ncbi:TPA: acyltransferase family protein [Escherichia coli]|nr:acyltransferase [Escherichia coli]HCK2107960.1 acyltransferase [Escherichia coli]HCL9688070.1 acyltransferase [Escherichia coli]HCL9936475.1 acyltransferase [Escherichia coli]
MSFFYDFSIYQLIAFIIFMMIVFLLPIKNNHVNAVVGNILWLEGLRGVACIMVFFNHFAYYLPTIGISNQNIPYKIMPIYDNFGSLGVEIFFAITGFLFLSRIKKVKGADDFMMKRIKRLAPAFLFFALINMAVFIIFMSDGASLDDYRKALIQLLSFGFLGGGIFFKDSWIHSIGVVSWTLPYEWIFYISIVAISLFYKNERYISITLFIIGIYTIEKSNLNTNMFLFFISGAVGKIVYDNSLNHDKKYWKLIISITAILTLLTCLYQKDDGYGIYRFILVTILFSSICYIKPKFLQSSNIVLIGMISYSIYLSHQAIIYLSLYVFKIIGVNLYEIGILSYFIMSIITFMITVIISLITYKNIELRFNSKVNSSLQVSHTK